MVGDVNSVKVIDKTSNTVIKNIVVSDSGLRADEGCFDPDHNIYMISSPEESPPFATFISTASLTVIGKVMFPNATGLEACDYNHATQTFLVNNDGTVDAANPHGEVDVIPAGAVTAGTAAAPITIADVRTIPGFKAFAEGNCDPAGLTLGPGNDMAINCRPVTVGSPLNVLIMDRTNGTILATVNAGGGDQIFYDPVTNAYFSGASRWNDTGKTINDGGTCSTALPCKPVLQIIDAVSRTLAATLPAGNNAHSVAVDGVTRKAFMPFSSATAPAGCAECAAFSAAGLAEYTI
jgi:hypothetical protein